MVRQGNWESRVARATCRADMQTALRSNSTGSQRRGESGPKTISSRMKTKDRDKGQDLARLPQKEDET